MYKLKPKDKGCGRTNDRPQQSSIQSINHPWRKRLTINCYYNIIA